MFRGPKSALSRRSDIAQQDRVAAEAARNAQDQPHALAARRRWEPRCHCSPRSCADAADSCVFLHLADAQPVSCNDSYKANRVDVRPS